MFKKMLKVLHQTDKLKTVKDEDEEVATLMGGKLDDNDVLT